MSGSVGSSVRDGFLETFNRTGEMLGMKKPPKFCRESMLLRPKKIIERIVRIGSS